MNGSTSESSHLIPGLVALEQRARTMGFQWESAQQIMGWAVSECTEVAEVLAMPPSPHRQQRLCEEIGDVFQVMLSLCVQEGLDVDSILAASGDKFRRRLEAMDVLMAQQGIATLEGLPWETAYTLWKAAKAQAG